MDKAIIDAEAKAFGILSEEWSKGYTVMDEADVPPELTIAKAQGADFQVTSIVGWIDIEPEDLTRFRHSCTYRFKKHVD